jgi:hypothetical protein
MKLRPFSLKDIFQEDLVVIDHDLKVLKTENSYYSLLIGKDE